MRTTCNCEPPHTRGDPEIMEEPEYTTWGWIMLSMFGMTPRPKYILFRCSVCRTEIGRSRDPVLLAHRSVHDAGHR